ncbi:MAG: DUF2029 domain-containing protein [Chloroflexota bacterium]|nr:DUF2029 domain-containing protein [Chloroflexota bacterium]MDE3102541.1 DUF2029 domain-containing protein [Chloroflexota bacterium]
MRRSLSLDAIVVGGVALGNWAMLFQNHTIVQVDASRPLWELFPGLWGAVWMLACGLLAATYPLRDLRLGPRFTGRQRVLHVAAIVLLFVVVPTIAAIVLRATGKPYTYVQDGGIMVEAAARKLLQGLDPYAVDYLDTPLFYWPMANNPALYHFTYFPLLFLVALPFVRVFDALHLFFDIRYLYLPAYLATCALLPFVIPASADRARTLAHRISLVAVVALDPELFPFVAEGRNDFFVLVFFVAGVALLMRERRTVAVLMFALAASAKLHASLFLPFLVAYLAFRERGRPPREALLRLVRAGWAGVAVMLVIFVPFIAWSPRAFWSDIVSYNTGGAAWSYPISGMGFSAILSSLGLIAYPQEDFPFWAFELLAAIPLSVWALRRLRRDPSVAELLLGSSIALFGFLYFGRYFQGNYLGYVAAVAAPVPFLRPDLVRELENAVRRHLGRPAVPVGIGAKVRAGPSASEGD